MKLEITDRDIKIIKMIAEGNTAVAIGNKLELSPRTIEARLELIKALLGAVSLANMIHLAHEKNIL